MRKPIIASLPFVAALTVCLTTVTAAKAADTCPEMPIAASFGDSLQSTGSADLGVRLALAAQFAESEWRAGIGEDTTPQHIDVYSEAGGWGEDAVGRNLDWCGFFAGYSLLTAGMNSAVVYGFNAATNVQALFTYGEDGSGYGRRAPDRLRSGESIREYHETMGLPRHWTSAQSVSDAASAGSFASLEFAAGDILLVDALRPATPEERERSRSHSANTSGQDGEPEHVAMVHSWNPVTGILVTIEGNTSSGRRVGANGGTSEWDSPDHRTAVTRREYNLNRPQDRAKVFGVGRLSPLDFSPTTQYCQSRGDKEPCDEGGGED